MDTNQQHQPFIQHPLCWVTGGIVLANCGPSEGVGGDDGGDDDTNKDIL